MHEWDNEKQKKFNSMFFTLKILALLFCTTPVFQYYFTENAFHIWSNFNILMPVVFLVVIIAVVILWFVVNIKFVNNKFCKYVEIVVYYLICLCALLYSGGYESYYKYMFLFMIVVYTMEYGFNLGSYVATISSITILAMDLIMYKSDGVNPYFQSDIALTAMFYLVAWVVGFYVKIEGEHISELKNRANIDFLTGLYNHCYFYETLENMFKNDPECEKAISVIMIDIDYFKSYNDLYGHQVGDDILKEIAYVIKSSSEQKDIICRYGGEEFTVIYPGINQKKAIEFANNIREKIYDHKFKGQELMPNHNLTISIGVSERKKSDDNVRNFIERADIALYRAKFFRKNRVELYTSVFEQFSDLDIDNDKGMTSVKALITIVNSRDHYTYSHTERVVIYCQIFADYLKLCNEEKKQLVYGAYLHDIGKINISKDILISNKKLTKEEWDEIKKHPIDSADIIGQMHQIDNNIVDIVRQHHERFDGSGYPYGLKGNNINELSRMLSISDSFDAMTANRPYQRKKNYEDAFEELRRCKGTQFDPDLVDKFIYAIDKLM
ncbi:diguanylate cyclase [Sedimentibacter sp. zth1]|uniref:bifunctional diguanylate cyclase/phosphohydrolase n=1 Tax=Sedimentibacter sp. zth1 TaxID=2816908 RepID=UPI001A91444B|nr:diguanylate cyclase [Sedimentibacter sp. zth1]QSX07060.1 diguanylate cyclase [Sedimentibacter sp. zth1]